MPAAEMIKTDFRLLAARALTEEFALAVRCEFSNDGQVAVLIAGGYLDSLHDKNHTAMPPIPQFLSILGVRYLTTTVAGLCLWVVHFKPTRSQQ